MSGPEKACGPENSEQQDALQFCLDVQRALRLAEQLNTGPKERTSDLEARAAAAAEAVIHQSAFGGLRFRLRVNIPPETRAETSRNWEVIDPSPTVFDVSEIRHLDSRGIEFYDSVTEYWLIVYGHTIEINPVFPGADA